MSDKEATFSGSNVIYIGHLPFGFFEQQIWAYFSQFGEVQQVRIRRNPRTGKSRHHGFVQFDDVETAEIVASTMDKYMMFGKTIVCHVVSEDNVHDNLFRGPGALSEAPENLNQLVKSAISIPKRKACPTPCTPKSQADKLESHISKAVKKARKLSALGIEYELPYHNTVTDEIKQVLLAENQ